MASRDRIVLFGGTDGVEYLQGTWEWDGERWHEVLSETTPPSGRAAAVMAFAIWYCW